MTRDRAPLITFAACVVVAVIAFASYAVHRQAIAEHRQHVANARAEAQRQAICAILANIPGHVPTEIQRARLVFARPRHPGDCQPIRRPKPVPQTAPSRRATGPIPVPGPTFIVVAPHPGQAPSPGPSTSPSPRPSRSPRPTPNPSRSPSPSPSPTCGLRHPLRCLPT